MFISSLKWEIQRSQLSTYYSRCRGSGLILASTNGLNAFERLLVGSSSSEYILRHAKVRFAGAKRTRKNLIITKKKKGAPSSSLLTIYFSFMAFVSPELALQFLLIAGPGAYFSSQLSGLKILWVTGSKWSLTIWKFSHIGLMDNIKIRSGSTTKQKTKLT